MVRSFARWSGISDPRLGLPCRVGGPGLLRGNVRVRRREQHRAAPQHGPRHRAAHGTAHRVRLHRPHSREAPRVRRARPAGPAGHAGPRRPVVRPLDDRRAAPGQRARPDLRVAQPGHSDRAPTGRPMRTAPWLQRPWGHSRPASERDATQVVLPRGDQFLAGLVMPAAAEHDAPSDAVLLPARLRRGIRRQGGAPAALRVPPLGSPGQHAPPARRHQDRWRAGRDRARCRVGYRRDRPRAAGGGRGGRRPTSTLPPRTLRSAATRSSGAACPTERRSSTATSCSWPTTSSRPTS